MIGLRKIYMARVGDSSVAVSGKSIADARRKAVRAYGSVDGMAADVTCPDCPLTTCNRAFGSNPGVYCGESVSITRRCHVNIRSFIVTSNREASHHNTLLEAVIYAIRLESGIGLARLHALKAEIQKRLRGET